MRLIDENNVVEYLREAGALGRDDSACAEWLSGGVSNVVLRISFGDPARADWVLKQARQQLRVAEPWYCPVERIWREVDTLRLCVERLPVGRASHLSLSADSQAGSSRHGATPADRRGDDGFTSAVPRIVFEDRPNYVYAMTAAPAEHAVWKQRLLAGDADPRIARTCGGLLGAIHATTWNDPSVAERFDDRSYFDHLRVDPYYRHVARRSDEFRPWLERLIGSLDAHRASLVHGDFSPKNLLVWDRTVMLIDFEVGHFGDPAFDLGFFLTHLTLKSIHLGPSRTVEYLNLAAEFWHAYRDRVVPRIGLPEFDALQARGIQNLAGCLIARLEGKSPVEYLTEPSHRSIARRLAADIFRREPPTWNDVTALLAR